MEFPFDVAGLLGAPAGREGPLVGLVDESHLRADSGMLSTVLEEMGKRSAAAQGLRKPVTSGAFLGDQRVYLLAQGKTALGVLKVGRKRLFVEAPFRSCELADVRNSFQEIEPLCTLDFYVHEKCQRSGFGHQLFSVMLQLEEIAPEQMGYDRPSPKLLAFLQKHHGLCKHKPQNNNFVVFDAFWDDVFKSDVRGRSGYTPSTCRQSASHRQPSAGRGVTSERKSVLSSGPAMDHQRHRRTAAPIF
ncbi:unnamed protein product [Symbiodinium necroappetens]|uniref:Alpha-tubulin N-acetyltransferase n=1 Tax=Symbiodinium necroappetens TaxID=1628268 RepID=A0A812T451_9DINO|nr:unnamed protein product [Symbiodinium necroappetens]|mmetsp:Transcript_54521/g.130241  ORF Transcript_54521/g.130241 Transcript_54521/m.130241 type:complete len:246 (+) Transcript_54521:69-806(+)